MSRHGKLAVAAKNPDGASRFGKLCPKEEEPLLSTITYQFTLLEKFLHRLGFHVLYNRISSHFSI